MIEPTTPSALVAVILFCSVATAPSNCTEHNAVRWVEHPVTSGLAVECLTQGNITASTLRLPEGYYLMVRCRRDLSLAR